MTQLLQGAGTAANGPFDPATLNPLVWLKPEAWAAMADAAAISSWANSGSGVALTQAVGGLQPTVRKAVKNGLDVVRFDGGDMLRAGFTLAQPAQVFAVAKFVDITGGQALWDGWATSNSMSLASASGVNNLRAYSGGANQPALFSDTNLEWHSYMVRYQGASSVYALDGAAEQTPAALGTSSPGGLGLAGIYSSGVTSGARVDIGEVLLFNTALSAANALAVAGYLKTKWGTP